MKKLRLSLFQKSRLLITWFMLYVTVVCSAQSGIRGTITDSNGNPMKYASVFVSETQSGAISNKHGYYELKLSPGEYTLKFQHLSYQAQIKKVTVDKSFQTLDIVLQPRPIQLRSVTISSGDEDPAYDIIRHAIAAAKYYRLVIEKYEATVYVKSFFAVEIPDYVNKVTELDDTAGYTVRETILKSVYKAPNTYSTHIISTRNNDNDSTAGADNFVSSTVYSPDFMGAVSPLSPKAFRFYRYRLENTFMEGDNLIHKVKVIPKTKSHLTFQGDIYIVEDSWGVHSFSLHINVYPLQVDIDQVFAPVDGGIWFPVNHNYDAEGVIFGINLGGKYLATLSDYNVILDSNLAFDVKAEIAGIDTAGYEVVRADTNNRNDTSAFSDLSFKSLNDLNKSLKEIEKAKRKERKEQRKQKKKKELEVVSSVNWSVDSMAHTRDSAYWAQKRPIPLTREEKTKGFSTKLEEMDEQDGSNEPDSSATAMIKKVLRTIAWGRKHYINQKYSYHLGSMISNASYNTVEGLVLELPLTLTRYTRHKLELSANGRYGFSSGRLYLKGGFKWTHDYAASWRNNNFYMYAGKYTKQFNGMNPVSPLENTLYTLFFRQNYMKLYEKEFVKLGGTKQLTHKLQLDLRMEYARRSMLQNSASYSFYYEEERDFSHNKPFNIELENTAFDTHETFLLNVGLEYLPSQKYVKRNGYLMPIPGSYPKLHLKYAAGLPSVFSSTASSYHRLEAGMEHQHEGVFFGYGIRLNIGNTFKQGNIHFPDFKHFNGNRTIFQKAEPLEGYRLLDYYRYSTAGAWINAMGMFSPNRFLVTQVPVIRLLGFSEYLSLNYLRTEHSPNYWEAGYGVGYLRKAMSLEFFTSWEELNYQRFGVRLRFMIQ